MDLVIRKYCSHYKIPIDVFYKACGLGIVSIYGIKVSYPVLCKIHSSLKQHLTKTLRKIAKRSSAKRSSKEPCVDQKFFRQFYNILKIIIPSIYSAEVGLLSAHTIALIARTFLSIYVASLESTIVKYIVRKDSRQFLFMLVNWLLVAIPATFVNSSLRFLENQLTLKFRSRLTKYSYDLYFKNETYYRVGNLDNRLENIDQCLTDDITAFASLVAHLYSRLTKPMLDIALMFISLYKLVSKMKGTVVAGPFFSFTMIAITGIILKAVSPRFGKLVAAEAEKKGQMRSTQSSVANNAEEIAFYAGHETEKRNLLRCYRDLIQHKMMIFKKRLWYIMLEQFLMKYVWSAGGLIMIALPLMTAKKAFDAEDDKLDGGISSRTQAFAFAKNLLNSGADASERLLSSYKKVIELAGYTARVSSMLEVFQEVSNGNFTRKTLATSNGLRTKVGESLSGHLVNGTLHPTGLVYEVDNMIKMENVPIITPNYDIIVKSMTVTITNDMHLLITGPNGCGKSSMFRIVSGLWPVYKGILHRPSRSNLFYIPQKPYMAVGTLRDQIIYPHSVDDMRSNDVTDKHLDQIMDTVSLKHIIQREGGWDAISDWKDVLSGGEKQRVGIARIFYHNPQFALLDECTSAVSLDVESRIYQRIKDSGITLLTITHRPSLWKFHTHILKFDGQGGWQFDELDHDASDVQRKSDAENSAKDQQLQNGFCSDQDEGN